MLWLLQIKDPTIKKINIETTTQFRFARSQFMWTVDQVR